MFQKSNHPLLAPDAEGAKFGALGSPAGELRNASPDMPLIGKTALIVDDLAAICTGMAGVFENLGAKTDQIKTLHYAKENASIENFIKHVVDFDNAKLKVDLVLTDFHLEGITSDKLIEQLYQRIDQHNAGSNKIPYPKIIAMSAIKDEAKPSLANLCARVLDKSTDLEHETLAKTLAQVFQLSSPQASALAERQVIVVDNCEVDLDLSKRELIRSQAQKPWLVDSVLCQAGQTLSSLVEQITDLVHPQRSCLILCDSELGSESGRKILGKEVIQLLQAKFSDRADVKFIQCTGNDRLPEQERPNNVPFISKDQILQKINQTAYELFLIKAE